MFKFLENMVSVFSPMPPVLSVEKMRLYAVACVYTLDSNKKISAMPILAKDETEAKQRAERLISIKYPKVKVIFSNVVVSNCASEKMVDRIRREC